MTTVRSLNDCLGAGRGRKNPQGPGSAGSFFKFGLHRLVAVCGSAHQGPGRGERRPSGWPYAESSANAPLHRDPKLRTSMLGRSAGGTLPAAPSRRLWYPQAARFFAVHGGARHDGMCERRRLQWQVAQNSRLRSPSSGVAMGFTTRSVCRSDYQRKTGLAGPPLPTRSGFRAVLGFNRHVLR